MGPLKRLMIWWVQLIPWAANVPIVRYLMAPFTLKLETLVGSD